MHRRIATMSLAATAASLVLGWSAWRDEPAAAQRPVRLVVFESFMRSA